ncbi:MAG TPA: glycerol-3-phosphate 1-O-acyltransferase PlsY [Bradyrhizobium sp.]|nr:glycerol-3-phosphate 1-O-acyltransferase PlsY [Bradyrhizobium sp.]
MLLYFIIGIIAYLLGSIPFGLILVRLFRNEDIRQQGSGNIGATNVIRSGSKGLGAVTFLLDAAKGFFAVVFAWQLAVHMHQTQFEAQNLAATAAICAIVGHIYTVWLGFKGGKGVATGFGVFLGIAPLSALVALLAFILVFAISRYVSLASIIAAIVLPLAALLRHHEPLTPLMIAAVIVLPLLIIAKHHANIRRLVAGTEYRFGKSKAATA